MLASITFLHVLAFVYWLGGDLGTFYASRFVTRSELGTEARAVALRIMLGCDQAPRLAMPLMFGTGLHLAAGYRFLPGGSALAISAWLVTAVWLAMVVALWRGEHAPWSHALARVDFWFRLAVLAVLAGSGTALLLGAVPGTPGWLTAKLLIFALLVSLGLVIRVKLRPFGHAWAALQRGEAGAETEATIRASVRGCTPYVHTIWLGLLVNAALGVHLL